jgi:hypothetical protein
VARIEKEGIPTVGIICKGFTESGRRIAEKEGVPAARIVEFPPPNILIQTPEAIYKSAETILKQVIDALTKNEPEPNAAISKTRVSPREIIFRGTLDEINDAFRKRHWTDGLPIMPPTVAAVEKFLQYTDRSPNEVVGILRPANDEASVWKVAVNGVMAGCRPEYMPVLLAVAEAASDPRFNMQEAASSSGWSPFITSAIKYCRNSYSMIQSVHGKD